MSCLCLWAARLVLVCACAKAMALSSPLVLGDAATCACQHSAGMHSRAFSVGMLVYNYRLSLLDVLCAQGTQEQSISISMAREASYFTCSAGLLRWVNVAMLLTFLPTCKCRETVPKVSAF